MGDLVLALFVHSAAWTLAWIFAAAVYLVWAETDWRRES